MLPEPCRCLQACVTVGRRKRAEALTIPGPWLTPRRMNLDKIKTALQNEVARKRGELRKLESAVEALMGPIGRLHARRKTMSRAARAKIGAAMRARWAAKRAGK